MLYLNNKPVDVTTFPDNTSQVWKLSSEILEEPLKTKKATIKWDFSHEGEFLQLAQLKRLLNEMRISCSLELTYLPYGRQDKEVSNETTFALSVFAKLLNGFNFYEVIIHDPHSQVALDLINWSKAVYPQTQLVQTLIATGAELVCYPDKGALFKYSKIYNYPHIFGSKVRDQQTGNITAYSVCGECYNKKVLIVDDICDGGATFKLLAKDLLAAGAKEVNLFVTHGIFSKGVRTLFDAGISRIFTKDGEIGKRHDTKQI